MIPRLGGWEWIIVLVIVVLLFGPGRIGKISGEIGRSIRAFREGLGGEKQDDQSTDSKGNIEPK
ncbi:MAG TPA: twin-arginine translocase TatA/TatE family subunit [Anaerolineales bacterium]|jgi:sec-independent protein translocase protein TatA|nr:twin-arginine translocase TatA/TatE family subunit [Anaerolineales bacterium]